MLTYQCELCKFTSLHKGQYRKHLQTKKHKNNLLIKQENVKYDETPHLCQFCSKQFSSHQSKKRHEEIACKCNPNSVRVKKRDITSNVDGEHIDTNHTNSLSIEPSIHLNNKTNMNNTISNQLVLLSPTTQNTSTPCFMKNKMDTPMTDSSHNHLSFNGDVITNTTTITINGIEIDKNPLKIPELKQILINAFSHPYFKDNIQFVPFEFLEDIDFLNNFNKVHKYNFEPSDLPQLKRDLHWIQRQNNKIQIAKLAKLQGDNLSKQTPRVINKNIVLDNTGHDEN
jgi:hypothetical protein